VNAEQKARKRAAIARRRHESYMRDVAKRLGPQCGHEDCEAFNAGSRAIAEALEWALSKNMPVEWITSMISRGLMIAIVVNRLTPADLNGEKAEHQPHEVN